MEVEFEPYNIGIHDPKKVNDNVWIIKNSNLEVYNNTTKNKLGDFIEGKVISVLGAIDVYFRANAAGDFLESSIKGVLTYPGGGKIVVDNDGSQGLLGDTWQIAYLEFLDTFCRTKVSQSLPEVLTSEGLSYGTVYGSNIACGHQRFTSSYAPEILSPITCCFKDANNSPTQSNSTNAKSEYSTDRGRYQTCDPLHRNLSNKTCKTLLFDNQNKEFCFTDKNGEKNNLDDIYTKWTTGEKNCYYAYERNVSAVPDEGLGTSIPGKDPMEPVYQPITSSLITNFNFATDKANTLATTIKNAGYKITSEIDSQDYHPLNDVLFQLCRDYPFACKEILATECLQETTSTLADNPNRLKWCGCHLQYQEYTKYYNVQKECTPMCNREGVIPNTGLDLKKKVCSDNTLCIIDNLNIIYTQKKGSGDINVKQMCGGCTTNCNCRIENNTIVLNNDMFKSDINLSELCGNQTLYTPNSTSVTPSNSNNSYLILILIIIAIILLGFIGNLFY